MQSLLFLFASRYCFQSQAQQIPTAIDVQIEQDLSGNIHVGPLKVHPGTEVKEDYPKNIVKHYVKKNEGFIAYPIYKPEEQAI